MVGSLTCRQKLSGKSRVADHLARGSVLQKEFRVTGSVTLSDKSRAILAVSSTVESLICEFRRTGGRENWDGSVAPQQAFRTGSTGRDASLPLTKTDCEQWMMAD